MDNYSIINFPEEAYYISSDQFKNSQMFCNVDYPTYPRYFIDLSYFFIKKKKLSVKPDVYTIDNKAILEKFQTLVNYNQRLKNVRLPIYHYFKYENKYQLMGFIKYKISEKDAGEKLQFLHYPLKFLILNEMITEYKKELPNMIVKTIESLPRYSHNYYISILKSMNIRSLFKRRWKFMFGFSVNFS